MRMGPNRVVSIVKTPVFLAKEYLHRRPDSRYQARFVSGDQRLTARAHADELRREGIILLPQYFGGEQLARFQAAFEAAVAGRPGTNQDSFYNDSVMQLDPAFLDAALDPFLLQIVGDYYQKQFGLGRADAMRLLPSAAGRTGSFQWHHDARGRQVHLMVLMSDVSREGQAMTYLRRSHSRYYSHYRGIAKTRFDKDLEGQDIADRIVWVAGTAGTVALFDANGLHSGNRNDVEGRDTLTFCYVSWRHFRKIQARKEHVNALSDARREVLTYNPHFSFAE